MAQLGYVLAIVLGINVMLWLGQVAVTELNPAGPVFYNCQGSLIANFEASQCTGTTYVLGDSDPSAVLPTTGSQVQVDNGNFFTDTFGAAVSWFTQSTGLRYLYNILAAPSNFIKAVGAPSQFAFAVGAMWYAFSLLAIVAFLFGRDY